MDLEITCQMKRDELLVLLDTMTPIEEQRITAEHAAAVPPPELAITFRRPSGTRLRTLPGTRIAVIGASFCLSFGLGLLAAMI